MLQYPLDMNTGLTDFISFQPEEYRANTGRGAGANAAGPPPAGSNQVILYMPNSTPTMANTNSWDQVDFVGPLGAAKRDFFASTTKALMDVNFGNAGSVGSTYVDDLKNQITRLKETGGGAAKQGLLQAGAGLVNQSPTTLLAISKGQIYNPNVELIYQGPKLRSFQFDFMLIAKSEAENTRVNEIILEFKRSSSPAPNGGMFEIPYVYNINYMTNGVPNRNMNRFKKSALISVATEANPTTDMHVSHIGGAPVAHSLSLTFQEVDIITREDHDQARGQGF